MKALPPALRRRRHGWDPVHAGHEVQRSRRAPLALVDDHPEIADPNLVLSSVTQHWSPPFGRQSVCAQQRWKVRRRDLCLSDSDPWSIRRFPALANVPHYLWHHYPSAEQPLTVRCVLCCEAPSRSSANMQTVSTKPDHNSIGRTTHQRFTSSHTVHRRLRKQRTRLLKFHHRLRGQRRPRTPRHHSPENDLCSTSTIFHR